MSGREKENPWKSGNQHPKLSRTLGSVGDPVQYSEFVIGYYPENLNYSDNIEDLKYRLIRYEKRATIERSGWYCPVTKVHVNPPKAWAPIIEYSDVWY